MLAPEAIASQGRRGGPRRIRGMNELHESAHGHFRADPRRARLDERLIACAGAADFGSPFPCSWRLTGKEQGRFYFWPDFAAFWGFFGKFYAAFSMSYFLASLLFNNREGPPAEQGRPRA